MQWHKIFSRKSPVWKAKTKYNSLEVVWQGGRMVLNALHVNYSFGSLHRVFQSAFQQLNPDFDVIRNVLILGFGAGSVAQILQHEKHCNCSITGVEIDEKVLELGRRFFQLDRLKNLKLNVTDADDFLSGTDERFDMIVVDLFLDDRIPEKFLQLAFLNRLSQHLTSDGVVLFNYLLYDFRSRQQKELFVAAFRSVFQEVRHLTVRKEPANYLLAGKKRSR